MLVRFISGRLLSFEMKPQLVLIASLLAVRVAAADFDVATSTNQVGIDLYRQLAAETPAKNLAISPYSIESALALAYAGADGETRAEMGRVLYLPQDDQPIQVAFAGVRESLDRMVVKSAQRAKLLERDGGHEDVVEWQAANRLFGQQGYAFRDSFLELLNTGYAAPFESLDFMHGAEKARVAINSWVGSQTKDKIRDLIPADGVDNSTRLVLVNAFYLKAPWAQPFKKAMTTDLPFHADGTRTETVPTMRTTTRLDYLKGNGFAAVVLPYAGGELQFLILLPDDQDGLGPLIAKLTPELLHDCSDRSQPLLVSLDLPKFRLEGSTIPLHEKLKALGMKTAFDLPPGSANFDRMAPRKPKDYLMISEVFHQTFVAIDEKGTEAAAATAVAMMMGGGGGRPFVPIEVRVDHPFLFAIQQRSSGVCLFIGSVAEPR